jgi:hypothetical protein
MYFLGLIAVVMCMTSVIVALSAVALRTVVADVNFNRP